MIDQLQAFKALLTNAETVRTVQFYRYLSFPRYSHSVIQRNQSEIQPLVMIRLPSETQNEKTGKCLVALGG